MAGRISPFLPILKLSVVSDLCLALVNPHSSLGGGGGWFWGFFCFCFFFPLPLSLMGRKEIPRECQSESSAVQAGEMRSSVRPLFLLCMCPALDLTVFSLALASANKL